MDLSEYLLSYGSMGDFGRFRCTTPLTVRRGERVVVRSFRGLELGAVLCEATPGHAHFLPNTTLGKLLRPATAGDERKAGQMAERAQRLFDDGLRLCAELALPLEVLDAEVMLDGKQGVVHHLSWEEYDERELVGRLSRRHDLQVTLHSLALPKEAEEEHGCGRPGCGRTEGGGCSTCGTGGGCSSCGSDAPGDLRAYFAGLRDKMAGSVRKPLL